MSSAFDIAEQYHRTIYDSLYLALAVQLGGRMVTADQRLYNSLTATAMGKHIVWVADFARRPVTPLCFHSSFCIPMLTPRYLVPFHPRELPHLFTDVLIIGGGLAGLRAALAIDPQLRVLVVTKDAIQQSNSSYAQGGIAGVLDPEDRFEDHMPTRSSPAARSATPRSSRWSSARPPSGSRS